MVWQYRSPIPVGSRGVISSFKWFKWSAPCGSNNRKKADHRYLILCPVHKTIYQRLGNAIFSSNSFVKNVLPLSSSNVYQGRFLSKNARKLHLELFPTFFLVCEKVEMYIWTDLGAALVVAALDVVLELVGLCGEDVGLLVRTVVGAVELHSAPVLHQGGRTELEIILGRHFLNLS